MHALRRDLDVKRTDRIGVFMLIDQGAGGVAGWILIGVGIIWLTADIVLFIRNNKSSKKKRMIDKFVLNKLILCKSAPLGAFCFCLSFLPIFPIYDTFGAKTVNE